jgi:perosamine synthetase
MFNIFLKSGDAKKRDELMRRLEDAGIETRPIFYPMHIMPPYFENNPYPIADLWAERGINLPTHQAMTPLLVNQVAETLKKYINSLFIPAIIAKLFQPITDNNLKTR